MQISADNWGSASAARGGGSTRAHLSQYLLNPSAAEFLESIDERSLLVVDISIVWLAFGAPRALWGDAFGLRAARFGDLGGRVPGRPTFPRSVPLTAPAARIYR
jgi:hypothetical protein